MRVWVGVTGYRCGGERGRVEDCNGDAACTCCLLIYGRRPNTEVVLE